MHGTRVTQLCKLALLSCALTFAGCKSAQDKANDAAIAQAKQQAASTGTAQQVVATNSDGSTTTTIVQPPAPGQTTQQITTIRSVRSTTNAATPPQPAQPTVTPLTSASVSPTNPALPPVITPVNVEIPAGTTLTIRINQHISVKTSRAGDEFTGEVVQPVMAQDNASVAIPRGTHVAGVIDESHRRGHFKGRSILELRLTSMELNGQRYALDTRDNVRTKKGKGKRSAAMIGGGAGLGMLVGGIATGGVGLVVGGLVGGGAGTAVGGLTGNRDIEIPAESVINFKLAEDLAVQPQQ